MKRMVIIYASRHHGNTRVLVEAIADRCGATLIDAAVQQHADLSAYELIGFASGIDFGRFYGCVERFLEENLPENKRVFFLYTCARSSGRFTESMKQAALKRSAVLLGEYGCKGYNTYGPWKLLGGMNKGHPDQTEVEAAVRFVESFCGT